MNRVVHFEIGAKDPGKAVEFYSEVFGWEIKKWEGPMEYWMVMTGSHDKPGIDGGIMRKEKDMPGVVNTVEVPSVDEFLKRISEKGGRVVRPKHAIPGVGYQAYCRDLEGNVFGIHQADTGAK